MRSSLSLRSFPNVTVETVLNMVWLTLAPSYPSQVRPLPLFSASLLQVLDDVSSWFVYLICKWEDIELRNISDLWKRNKPLLVAAFPASRSVRSFPSVQTRPESIHMYEGANDLLNRL